ncbi:MAG: hypothetical protein H7Y11_15745 [Armatimonadetes bacterium]|nr:hypothetical protein [Anaerolineae bacterium]
MTVAELLKQAQALSPQERDELVQQLITLRDANGDSATPQPKTGAEIVAMLKAMEPIELVDAHIEDPVAWVNAQRDKRTQQLKSYRDGEA